VLETSYGAAVNRGAARARSELLVVMRGDTLVGPDWLEPMLSTAERWDAAVTPCVTGFDGAVLDAGYLATRRGELVAFARGSTIDDPFWSFVRDVSCPSPACFLVRRQAFFAAGGFDPSVARTPLVETADLALALAVVVGFDGEFQFCHRLAPARPGIRASRGAKLRRWSAKCLISKVSIAPLQVMTQSWAT